MIGPIGDASRGGLVYALGSPATGLKVFRELRSSFKSRVEQDPRHGRTYYDTFDRRLHRRGVILAATRTAGETLLSWEDLAGRPVRRLQTQAPPAFAADLPPGPFREALAAIIDVRRLMEVGRERNRARELSILNGSEKTVARVAWEQWGEEVLLRVAPVKGYGKPLRRLVHHLEEVLELRPTEAPRAVVDLTVPPRSDVRLDPAARADESAKQIFRALLATLQVNEEGTRLALDPEFLHEFRVAVRRTRAALSQLDGLFPVRSVARFKRDFSWLGRATGPKRDLDVYLIKLEKYELGVPEEVRPHLAPVRSHLRGRQSEEQARLATLFGSPRYRGLVRSWRAFLDRPCPARPGSPHAATPMLRFASQRIWRVHRRVLTRGARIAEDTPAAALHRVRLDCKKLRYLMEFSRSLFDGVAMKRQVQALKRLQENLGDFNDLEVQQAALMGMAEEMAAAGEAPVETVLAMGRLVEGLRNRQEEERRRFQRRFAEFAARANRNRARRLFKEGQA